jgi:excisionase family DNA binding protein
MARAKSRTNIDQRLAFSAEEAAAVLGVSLTTMLRWQKRGLVPTSRIGRRRFVSRRALDTLLAGESLPARDEVAAR